MYLRKNERKLTLFEVQLFEAQIRVRFTAFNKFFDAFNLKLGIEAKIRSRGEEIIPISRNSRVILLLQFLKFELKNKKTNKHYTKIKR